MASNSDNNPYVQSGNQTVISNITSSAGGAVQNISKNSQGALGSLGSLATSVLQVLSLAGLRPSSSGDIMSSQLDTLISGSDSFFSSGSPSRISQNALANRNLKSSEKSNPDIAISQNKNNTNSGAALQYPSDLPPYFMMLTFHDYKRQESFGHTTLPPAGPAIVLPLPDGSGLYDHTTAIYNQTGLGIFGNSLTAMKDVASIRSAGFGESAAEASVYGLDSLASAVSSELAGAGESQLGLVPNPSLSMLFKGVNFREFNLKWTLSAKTEAESNTIRAIIRTLKKNHLPTLTSGAHLLFNYPKIVKPTIGGSAGSAAGEFMTDFEYCVLNAVNVDYSPQGEAPSFYAKSKAPVFISIQIQLTEMQYRLPGSYGGNDIGGSAYDAIKKGGGNAIDDMINGLPIPAPAEKNK